MYRILLPSLESLWRFRMHTNMHVSMPTVAGDCRRTKVLAVLLCSEYALRETLQRLTGQFPRTWGTGYKGKPAASSSHHGVILNVVLFDSTWCLAGSCLLFHKEWKFTCTYISSMVMSKCRKTAHRIKSSNYIQYGEAVQLLDLKTAQ